MAPCRKWIALLLVVLALAAMARCRDQSAPDGPRDRRTHNRGREVGASRRSRDERRRGEPRPASGYPDWTRRHRPPDGRDDAGLHDGAPDDVTDGRAVTSESRDVVTTAGAPTASTTQGTITKEQWQKRMRAKYTRMFIIQSQILRGLGLRQQPNVTGRKVTQTDIGVINRYVQKLNETGRRYNTESVYAERLLVYNPSCEAPPRTHKAWRDPGYFRLYFPLEPPATNPTVQSRLMSAQLRLYKTGPKECNCTSDSDDDADDSAPGGRVAKTSNKSKSLRRAKRILRRTKKQKFARSLKRGKKRRQAKNKRSRSSRGQGHMMDDEVEDLVRVTVYWFRKPIKKDAKAAKKQLAGSVMVRRSYKGWVEVNIKTPVKRWVKRPNKNFGLEVRVEDTNQRQVNPYTVFKGVNCTSEGGEENLFVDLASLNEALLVNETLYRQSYDAVHPTLEIAHVDVPVTVTRPRRHTSETCVLKKEFFSMEELGLNDWIIAPGGIALGVCEGHCLPVSQGVHYDKDRIAMEQDAQTGCCGPTEMQSFTFLQIMDDHRIAISSIPDFIVTKCGCRI